MIIIMPLLFIDINKHTLLVLGWSIILALLLSLLGLNCYFPLPIPCRTSYVAFPGCGIAQSLLIFGQSGIVVLHSRHKAFRCRCAHAFTGKRINSKANSMIYNTLFNIPYSVHVRNNYFYTFNL